MSWAGDEHAATLVRRVVIHRRHGDPVQSEEDAELGAVMDEVIEKICAKDEESRLREDHLLRRQQ